MVGRPKKYDENDPRIQIAINVPASVKFSIPRAVNLSEEITQYLREKYGNKRKAELEQLIKERDELKTKLTIVELKIEQLQKEIEEQKRVEKEIHLHEFYAVFKFMDLYNNQIDLKRFNISPVLIADLGIKFDYERLDKDIRNGELRGKISFDEAILISKKYNCQFIGLNTELARKEYDRFLKLYESNEIKIKEAEK